MSPDGIQFREQLQILIGSVPAPDGLPYSLAAIAEATELSEQSLRYLLEGRTEYPRLNTARRLCSFYDISLDYFGCETEADCRAYLAQLVSQRASPLLREIDQTADTLTPSSKRRVFRLLERFRNLGGSSKH